MKHNILYTFRRCPYAIRARWSLIKAKKSVVWREVLLSNKPKQLLDISPKGTVPILLTTSGETLVESLEIMHWALSNHKSSNILRINNNNKSSYYTMHDLIHYNDTIFKYHLDRYKYSQRYPQNDPLFHQKEARKFLVHLSNRLSLVNTLYRSYLLGNEESLADWAIWPFVRQYRLIDISRFDSDTELNSLRIWLMSYINDLDYRNLMLKSKPWEPNQTIKFFPH